MLGVIVLKKDFETSKSLVNRLYRFDDNRKIRYYHNTIKMYENYSLEELKALLIEKKFALKRSELLSTLGITVFLSAILADLGNKLYDWILNYFTFMNMTKEKLAVVSKATLKEKYATNVFIGGIVIAVLTILLFFVILMILQVAEKYRTILYLESLIEEKRVVIENNNRPIKRRSRMYK